MDSPLEIFAGLLDRSVQEIAALTADCRRFDTERIGRIADIWDNNTFPLVSAAGAFPPFRSGQARAGLLWMAGLGAARRDLMVELDPNLAGILPAAAPERSVYRDYYQQVHPGVFAVTDDLMAGLTLDYDLANASVRFLAVRPGNAGLELQLTLACPRRFTPGNGYAAPDGSRKPWPEAPLRFTFAGVTDLRFDAEDRIGMAVVRGDAGLSAVIGQSGRLQATAASVWPNDPCWHESAAGKAADLTTPHDRADPPKPVSTATLTAQQRTAARALVRLMIDVRLVHYYPRLAARVPVSEICRIAANAGSAILAASAHHGSARRKAFAELEGRWGRVPPELEPASIPTGPVVLRYANYEEPHTHYDDPREGSAVLLAAVPGTDAAAPWTLACDEIAQPAQFRIATTAFEGIQQVRRSADALNIDNALVVRSSALGSGALPKTG